MRSVVGYCRSACEPEDGPSAVHSQAEAIRAFATRWGLTLRSFYMDAGVSGATLERPALQKLIADCRAGKVGTIITKDPERLSRDMGQLLALLLTFKEVHVRVEFSAHDERPDTLLEPVIAAIAELREAATSSKRKQN